MGSFDWENQGRLPVLMAPEWMCDRILVNRERGKPARPKQEEEHRPGDRSTSGQSPASTFPGLPHSGPIIISRRQELLSCG